MQGMLLVPAGMSPGVPTVDHSDQHQGFSPCRGSPESRVHRLRIMCYDVSRPGPNGISLDRGGIGWKSCS